MGSGFAAGFANQLPQAEAMYQKIIAGRQQLQQAARQQQANEAFFKSLVTPDAGAIPQQGPPGMTLTAQRGTDGSYSVPQAAPPAPGVPGMPGTPSGPAAGPGGPPPQASAGPAPPAGGVPSQPPGAAAGGRQFSSTQRLR